MARYNYHFTYNNYTTTGEDNLKQWLTDNAKYAVFGHEIAPTTGTPHLQGYFSLKKKKRMTTIQSALKKLKVKLSIIIAEGTAEENRVYCTKDKDFWEVGTINITGHKPKEDQNAAYKEALEQPTAELALAVIKEKRPRDYVLYNESIERCFKKHYISDHVAIYDLSKFRAPPLVFDNRAILLWGTTGFGKTQFALAHFKNPLLVRHLDSLAGLSPLHDGIVFDDVDLKNRPPNSIIHLLDWDCESSVHIRYKVATIPKKTKKIFTSNQENPFYEICTNEEITAAIERRLRKIEINEILF